MAATLAAATIERPAPTPLPPGHTYTPAPAPTVVPVTRTSDEELAAYWAQVATLAKGGAAAASTTPRARP